MFRPLEFGRPDFPFDGAALLNPSGAVFEVAEMRRFALR